MIDQFDGRPYQSIEDWKKEVRHLKWPTIIILLLILVFILFIDLYV